MEANGKVEQISGKAQKKIGRARRFSSRYASIRHLKNKENRYGRHNLDRHPDFAVSGCIAHMASQPQLGLLPEWRVGLDPVDSAHPAPVRPHIGGRIDCSGLQPSVQELWLTGHNRKRTGQGSSRR